MVYWSHIIGGFTVSSFLEIVELVNGDIVLQRADGEGDALMTIHFSDESKNYLPEGRLEVARAMIHAGIETASQLEIVRSESGEKNEGRESDTRLTDDAESRVLH
jgi:hypothetical protein